MTTFSIPSLCKNCNAQFIKTHPSNQYCSSRCKWTWNNHNRTLKPNIKYTCEVCGRIVERYLAPSKQGDGQGRFCSRKCKGVALSGSNHPYWKGGEVLSNGYVYVSNPDHPHADSHGRVKRSRLVMEDLIGRYLDPLEVVHHENFVEDDDRPKNLMLFKNQVEHKRYESEHRIRDIFGRFVAKEGDNGGSSN